MLNQFLKAFSEAAGRQGIDQVDYYVEETGGRGSAVYKGQLESITLYERTAVFIEGCYEGFKGTAYTEELSLADIDYLIGRIKETALENQVPFVKRELPGENGTIDAAEYREDTKELLKAEEEAYKDARIRNVSCQSSQGWRRILLSNETGAFREDGQRYQSCGVSVVATEEERTQTGRCGRIGAFDQPVDVIALAGEARERAISMLHSVSLPSGSRQVILGGGVIREMLSMYIASFYGQSLLDSKTVLKEKKGEQIAAFCVNLAEDPAGILPRTFDDEGQPCRYKEIIRDGVMTGWLHSLKSAAALNEKATGNGFKREYLEDTSAGYTNLVLKAGEKSLEELFAEMGDGIYITECDGMFAGANPVSGDFALISKGYQIVDGKKGQAVSQITVAGNFFEMLKQVRCLANDSQTERFVTSTVTAPAVWVGELSISGRDQ